MREKFGRRLRNDQFGFNFEIDFEVESYLRYRGSQFVDRFDANSYLYITKAMDYFDLARPRTDSRRRLERRDGAIPGDQLHVGLAVSQLPIARNRQRAARPEQGRRLLRIAVELRPRRVPGGRRGADRTGPRIPGEHVQGVRISRCRLPPRNLYARPFVRSLLGRSDYAIISELIEPGTRVLDLGCGEGELLAGWLRTRTLRRAASRSSARRCSEPSRAAFRSTRATSIRAWPTTRTTSSTT